MITDELREWARRYAYFKAEVIAIADRIDAAHERAVTAAHSNGITEYGSMVAREYVKLPVDADGVPIHVGDELDGLHYEDGTVTGIQYGTDGRTMIAVRPNGWDTSTWRDPEEYRHRIADSWERIIEDAVKNGMYDHDNERIQQKLVERCRRLAGAE